MNLFSKKEDFNSQCDHKVKRQIFWLLLSFEVIMAYSALGYIDIKPISMTFMTLPVVVGALYLGTRASTIYGVVFGLSSMWKASVCAITYGDQIFSPWLSEKPIQSVLLSTGTRAVFGLVAGLMFSIAKRKGRTKPLHIFLTSMFSFGVHTGVVYLCMYFCFPAVLRDATHFSITEFLLAFGVTYLIPAAMILLIDRLTKTKYVQKVYNAGRELVMNRKKLAQRKTAVIMASTLVGVTILLLMHVYGRIKLVFLAHGVNVSGQTLSGILQVQFQLLVSMLSLFYIIYIVLIYMFEFSQARKEEVNKLNQALKENEKYKQAVEQALEKAKNANDAKTQFLSRMSHDIRTPLNAIIGLSAIGIDDSMDSPKERESFQKIWKSGNYLLGLVNDILDFSRIESQSVELHPEPFLVTNCIDDIYIILREQMEEKQITYQYHSNGEQGYALLIDPMRFEQIFMNLISNSVKYTNRYGTIDVTTLIERQNSSKAKLTCRVCDNGIGMSPEFMKVMYQPYVQGKDSSENKGSGLGLAIVKNLVELMNGSMNVKSKLNGGTEFELEFLFDMTDNLINDEPNQTMNEHVLVGKHVLLVEDNMINIEVGVILLQKKGMIVDVAKNGQEAVEQFEAKKNDYYDLILMDIFMPVMNGNQAVQLIRKSSKSYAKTVPIIAMTANVMEDDMKEALQCGMNDYLTKPIIPNHLYAELSKWLK